jgi:hypothetical protein
MIVRAVGLRGDQGRPRHFKQFIFLVCCALALLRCLSAEAQSVTLAWDPVTDSPVAGYKLYEGTNSGIYNQSFDAGLATQMAVSNLILGLTYYFAVVSYDASGLESAYSSEISYVPSASAPFLNIAANAGSIAGGFLVTNGVIYQTTTTSASSGGRIVFPFSVPIAGNYIVSAVVSAPNASANMFFVNIDSEPTSPANTWNVPVANGFTNEFVAWNTSSSPQVFTLAAGQHQLIFRGSDAYTLLKSVTISPANPVLRLAVTNQVALLTGIGQPSHTYAVEASSELKHWIPVGRVIPDPVGMLSFVDAPGNVAMRAYRLRDLLGQTGASLHLAFTNRAATVSGIGQPAHVYSIETSTNLSTWAAIGGATSTQNGGFAFIDSATPISKSRYYRARDVTP